jgi:hypothetical protein
MIVAVDDPGLYQLLYYARMVEFQGAKELPGCSALLHICQHMETLAICNLDGYIGSDERSAESLQQRESLEMILSHHAATRLTPMKNLLLKYDSSGTLPSSFERNVMTTRWKDASWVESVRWEG